MKRINLSLALLASLLAHRALANDMGRGNTQTKWPLINTLSVGPVWQNNGNTQTFYLAPDVQKTYAANLSTNTLADGEIFLGLQKDLSHQFQSQVGLAVVIAGTAKLSGHIWDDAEPQFNNYTYTYQVNHVHLALKGKLLADRGYWLIPWMSGSLGIGFNRAYAFNNTPTVFEALPNANFSSNTETAFTYTLGAGVQHALNQHWKASIGYAFADWGKSQLELASGQTLNSGLSLNHLYTNGFLLDFTYVA